MQTAALQSPATTPEGAPAVIERPQTELSATLPAAAPEKPARSEAAAQIDAALQHGKSALRVCLDATAGLQHGVRILAALGYRGGMEGLPQTLSAEEISVIIGGSRAKIASECVSLHELGLVETEDGGHWRAVPEVVRACRAGALQDCLCTFDTETLGVKVAARPYAPKKSEEVSASLAKVRSLIEQAPIPNFEREAILGYIAAHPNERPREKAKPELAAQIMKSLSDAVHVQDNLTGPTADFVLKRAAKGDFSVARVILRWLDSQRNLESSKISVMPDAADEE